MDGKKIVVTGTGTVNPLGNSVKDTWEHASNGISGIGEITRFDASHLQARIAGEVKDFDYRSVFSEEALKTANRMDPFVHYAAAAVSQALEQSGFDIQSSPERIGICMSSGMGGMSAQHKNSAALATKGARRVSPFYIPAAIGNIASGFISIIHGIRGPNLSMQTACATANHSLISAFLIIRAGMADIMVTGGSEAAILELGVAGFANMRALSTNFNDEPQRASRPYDVDRDGFVMSEGAGVIIVEEFEHAKARGADILCEIKSIGMSGDAYDLVMPEPGGKGAYQSMKMAVDQAELAPEEIHYINSSFDIAIEGIAAHTFKLFHGELGHSFSRLLVRGEYQLHTAVGYFWMVYYPRCGSYYLGDSGLVVRSQERGAVGRDNCVTNSVPKLLIGLRGNRLSTFELYCRAIVIFMDSRFHTLTGDIGYRINVCHKSDGRAFCSASGWLDARNQVALIG